MARATIPAERNWAVLDLEAGALVGLEAFASWIWSVDYRVTSTDKRLFVPMVIVFKILFSKSIRGRIFDCAVQFKLQRLVLFGRVPHMCSECGFSPAAGSGGSCTAAVCWFAADFPGAPWMQVLVMRVRCQTKKYEGRFERLDTFVWLRSRCPTCSRSRPGQRVEIQPRRGGLPEAVGGHLIHEWEHPKPHRQTNFRRELFNFKLAYFYSVSVILL